MKHGDLVANEKQATPEEIKHFQKMVGSIMFVMIETRPTIAISTTVPPGCDAAATHVWDMQNEWTVIKASGRL